MPIVHKVDAAWEEVVKSDPWFSGTVQSPSHGLNLFFVDKMDPPRPQLVKLTNSTHPSEFETLSASCDRATLGRAQEDMLEESYRKAGELDLGRFSLPFDVHATKILPTIISYLSGGEIAKRGAEAELKKLNVYDKGSFCRPYKNTPGSERMFGSLVVVFPTPHTGGELVLRHEEKTFTFDSGKLLAGSPDKVAFVAFFSGVEHEVFPVTSGHRVTLTYNLYYPDPTSSQPPPIISNLKDALSDLLEDPKFLPDGGFFGFSLSHSYPVTRGETKLNDLLPTLKGEDRMIRDACSELGLGVSVKSALQDTTRHHEYRCEQLRLPEKDQYRRCIVMDDVEDLSSRGSIEQELIEHFIERGKGTLVHPYDKKYVDSRNPIDPSFSLLLALSPILAAATTMRKTYPKSKAVAWISELEVFGDEGDGEDEDEDEDEGEEQKKKKRKENMKCLSLHTETRHSTTVAVGCSYCSA